MQEIPLSVLVGGGSILISLGFFLCKGKDFSGLKKIFSGGRKELKKKIADLEVKEAAKVIEVKEAEKKVDRIKEKVNSFVKEAKREIKEAGKITDSEKLLEEFNQW